MRYLLCLALLAAACGTDEDAASNELDVRVPIPAADPAFLDIVTPEVVIPSGVEQMWCYSYTYTGEEIAMSGIDPRQGNYGHHAVLLTAKEPAADGSLIDCTDRTLMWNYEPFAVPTDLPEGHGIRLPTGQQLVVQFHYVNASPSPIRVRDVIRVAKLPVAEVTTWAAMFATADIAFNIPAGQQLEYTFDCTVEQPLSLLFVAGHMHERGTSFSLQIQPPGGSFERLYLVDPWRPEYRDIPPPQSYFTDPYELAAGTVIRTTCAWDNDTGEAITFPKEMCVAVGYIGGTQTNWICTNE
jgi:hypothetical protein